jgi:hypothetical protein
MIKEIKIREHARKPSNIYENKNSYSGDAV